VIATLAIEIATAGFSIYLERFADFDRIYGPLGAVFALLVLVYVMSVILLFGACLTAEWGTSAGQAEALSARRASGA
jgi:membrane protein